MFEPDQYELLDFGSGEKLERFGNHVVRRRSPSVDHYSANKRSWSSDLNFQREPQPRWHPALGDDAAWAIWHRNACFQLKQSPAGQVGLFPEQSDNWDWIESCRAQISGMRAINLFAYTGGTTMQLADCGVEVTHVDAAKPVVQWARLNVESSKIADPKVRWIVDDAVAYIRREVSRGRKYDIVVADPPSFGRGPKGAVWKLERDLPKLLGLLKEAAPDLKMLILSCHTPDTNAADLRRLVNAQNMTAGGQGETLSLRLRARSKRTLDNGECFRWKGF